MSSNEPEVGDETHAPGIIRPGPDAEGPLDVAADARRKKERAPTLSERHEARVESYIAELRGDKQNLQMEVRSLRTVEIHHLREDVRWLENLISWQSQALTRLQTSYEWAITFNWLSSALVAIGGGIVSLAAFISLQPATQKMVASTGFVGLLIGVGIQLVVSYRGSRVLFRNSGPPSDISRPSPNPQRGSTTAPP
jgi:hypothetical protein